MEQGNKKSPFAFSDTEKRYHTYDYYLRRHFGEKCLKIPVDGGFTCPNIDGRCGYGGCIYCSGRGSGDFAPSPLLSVKDQLQAGREALSRKWGEKPVIAYFQAHTNTYAPLARLKELFEAALSEKDVVGLNIATRADCLEPEVLGYLRNLSERTTLTVELGLQTVHDDTAAFIRRGYPYQVFEDAYRRLRQEVPKGRICLHLILGLPHEDDGKMLATVRAVAALHPHEVKLHLLYVVKGTPLCTLYEKGEYTPLSMDHYVKLLVDALELLPPETVVSRVTGDGAKDTTAAPLWSLRKRAVLAAIDKELVKRNTVQGMRYRKAGETE